MLAAWKVEPCSSKKKNQANCVRHSVLLDFESSWRRKGRFPVSCPFFCMCYCQNLEQCIRRLSTEITPRFFLSVLAIHAPIQITFCCGSCVSFFQWCASTVQVLRWPASTRSIYCLHRPVVEINVYFRFSKGKYVDTFFQVARFYAVFSLASSFRTHAQTYTSRSALMRKHVTGIEALLAIHLYQFSCV